MSEAAAGRPASPRRWPAVLAWTLWALVALGTVGIFWFDDMVARAGHPELALVEPSTIPAVFGVVTAPTVGAVLASRRPRHPVGWLLLALGLAVLSVGVAEAYASYGLVARPGSLAGAGYVAAYGNGALNLAPACVGFILLLTPTGSLPSPRWRWWARTAAVAPVVAVAAWLPASFIEPYEEAPNPVAVGGVLGGALAVVANATAVVSLLGVPVAAWSLVVRARRARGEERLQLRWVAFAAALAAAGVAVLLAGLTTSSDALEIWGSAVFTALPPLAIGASILRYRLYDLDRIISRTIAYGLLTLLLGLGYAGVVLTLGQLPGGEGSNLAVAAATLAVAAVFQPARRRIQTAVDRRFNRRRYDAARTIELFSGRLRQQIDLDALSSELLTVVDQTMQPTRAALWLRSAGHTPSRDAGSP